MLIKDNFRISKSHWYGFLPRRVQTILVATGIKLGFIHKYGKLEVLVNHADGTNTRTIGYNLLTDVGLKHLGDILTGTEATNIDLGYIEAGTGATVASVSNIGLGSPLVPAARIAATSQTRATLSPFEVTISGFIGGTDYTRPQTINELAIYFTPDTTGVLFARGVLTTGIVLAVSDTATLTYAMVWR